MHIYGELSKHSSRAHIKLELDVHNNYDMCGNIGYSLFHTIQ